MLLRLIAKVPNSFCSPTLGYGLSRNTHGYTFLADTVRPAAVAAQPWGLRVVTSRDPAVQPLPAALDTAVPRQTASGLCDPGARQELFR